MTQSVTFSDDERIAVGVCVCTTVNAPALILQQGDEMLTIPLSVEDAVGIAMGLQVACGVVRVRAEVDAALPAPTVSDVGRA